MDPNGGILFGPPDVQFARGNILEATDGPDVIVGTDGNDFIDGMGGNDIICGGKGDDIIEGGDGSDRYNGGDGYDECREFSTFDVTPEQAAFFGDRDVANGCERTSPGIEIVK